MLESGFEVLQDKQSAPLKNEVPEPVITELTM
jgi:hypothetical protein